MKENQKTVYLYTVWCYTACSRENTSSHLITEVKSCLAGLISRWATILVALCCMPWEVRLALYSTFLPPTSAIVCGLRFSWSRPDLRVFLQLLQFSSLAKIDSQSKTSALGAVLQDHAWPFGSSLRHLSFALGWSHLSCALHNSALRAASKGD